MKKKLALLLLAMLPALGFSAGWPAYYGGVMLQGFYWDSYDDTGWQLFMQQSDELTEAFDLIWIPNSGKVDPNGVAKKMGYTPIWWLDHNTCFGSETDLREMIKTFKAKGTGFIMDAVLNHKDAESDWVMFANEMVKGQNSGKVYRVEWDNDRHTQIVRGDECVAAGYPVGGNDDTGENFDGARDLDHTNVTTQENVKTYIDFLLNELGYSGFRYDETKGYDPYYTGMYDYAMKPMFAVGEYWDGNADVLRWWLEATKRNDQIQSATFDFCLKYRLNETFNNSNWSALSDKGLAADVNYSRWAITFLDNHDTGRDGYQKISNNTMAANACILALPGTPCIYLPHWMTYKTQILNCIKGRRAAGVNNMSPILTQQESNGGYIIEVEGTTGKVYLQLGPATNNGTPSGYQLVQSGTNYKYYVSNGLDWKNAPKIGALPGDPQPTAFPQSNNVTVFVKADDPNSSRLYAWDSEGKQPMGNWPGTILKSLPHTYVGGAKWYYKTFDTPTISVIVNNSYGGENNQTEDIVNLSGNVFIDYPQTDNNGSIYNNVTTAYTPYINYQIPEAATAENGKIYCYLETDRYEAPNIYTWDNMDKHYSGDWSGTKMEQVGTATNGKKIFRWVSAEEYDLKNLPQHVIFNDGNSSQTADLDFVNGGYYTLDGLVGLANGHQDPVEKEPVYILGEVNDNGGWYADKGYEMETEDGINYTAKVTTQGLNSGYSYFSFTKKLADEPTAWSSISSYRFGADTEEENFLVTPDLLGTQLPLAADGTEKAFQIPAGEWHFDLNLGERTLTITSNKLIGDINGDEKVDVSDVTELINYILVGYHDPAADLNGDGTVNVSDVTTLINIILNL